PLEGAPPPTVDKLIVEPLSVAQLIVDADIGWFDLGSGGGSPAVPLKIVKPLARLTLVESRTKKAAFLREVVRRLDLSATTVFQGRIEDLYFRFPERQADLVTVRAVKMSAPLARVINRILTDDGELFLFWSNLGEALTGFELVRNYPLLTSTVP